jgi:hypothetical protein
MRMDDEVRQLLVDLLHALVACPHQLPPELVGRVLLAVGPGMLASAPYYTPPPPDESQRITTWPGPWG